MGLQIPLTDRSFCTFNKHIPDDGFFVHIGITPQVNKNNVTWLKPVSEEEYESLD